MAGNFYASAQDVRLEGPILIARLRNENGDWEDAEIDLNGIIGNDDGHFVWKEPNFIGTAREVVFNFEGADNVPVLRAQLRNRQGNWVPADINLGERLINRDGRFEFQY
ncbi:cyanovirin-N [Aspergillus arachidicola]|uniref:Cyanovirin-N n=1 Tax=Aspergillus arachidicola TaxID=656916 RepID=A0A2G7FG63_9EURO|nr:cyanovirin-N [Aspergillus arachidicola]